jgi:hypothetical protein
MVIFLAALTVVVTHASAAPVTAWARTGYPRFEVTSSLDGAEHMGGRCAPVPPTFTLNDMLRPVAHEVLLTNDFSPGEAVSGDDRPQTLRHSPTLAAAGLLLSAAVIVRRWRNFS